MNIRGFRSTVMGKTLKDEGIKCHLLQENPSIVALIFVAISILVVDNNEPPGFVPMSLIYLCMSLTHLFIELTLLFSLISADFCSENF